MRSTDYAVTWCLSVCLSVTHRYSAKTAKSIIKCFTEGQPHYSSYSGAAYPKVRDNSSRCCLPRSPGQQQHRKYQNRIWWSATAELLILSNNASTAFHLQWQVTDVIFICLHDASSKSSNVLLLQVNNTANVLVVTIPIKKFSYC